MKFNVSKEDYSALSVSELVDCIDSLTTSDLLPLENANLALQRINRFLLNRYVLNQDDDYQRVLFTVNKLLKDSDQSQQLNIYIDSFDIEVIKAAIMSIKGQVGNKFDSHQEVHLIARSDLSKTNTVFAKYNDLYIGIHIDLDGYLNGMQVIAHHSASKEQYDFASTKSEDCITGERISVGGASSGIASIHDITSVDELIYKLKNLLFTEDFKNRLGKSLGCRVNVKFNC